MTSEFIYKHKKDIGDREEQQDDLIILKSRDKQRLLLVLADGMGGHRGGKQASMSVIFAAKDVWQASSEGTTLSPEEMLNNIVIQAYDKMKRCETENISPRSTCVILFIKDNVAYYSHLGDSRLYHFRKRQLLNRTKDHSVVQMLVDMGQVAEENMGTHEDQGRLLKWIGGKKAPDEIKVITSEIKRGDHFLLCSDGLWEYIELAEMERLLKSKYSLNAIADYMLKAARRKAEGHGDNISLILFEIKDTLFSKWLPF